MPLYTANLFTGAWYDYSSAFISGWSLCQSFSYILSCYGLLWFLFLFSFFCSVSYDWSKIMKSLGILILRLSAHPKCSFICSLYYIFFLSLCLSACLGLFSSVRSNNILWKKKVIFVFIIISESGQNLLTNIDVNCGTCERRSLTVTPKNAPIFKTGCRFGLAHAIEY